eukprot:CFRG5626T1
MSYPTQHGYAPQQPHSNQTAPGDGYPPAVGGHPSEKAPSGAYQSAAGVAPSYPPGVGSTTGYPPTAPGQAAYGQPSTPGFPYGPPVHSSQPGQYGPTPSIVPCQSAMYSTNEYQRNGASGYPPAQAQAYPPVQAQGHPPAQFQNYPPTPSPSYTPQNGQPGGYPSAVGQPGQYPSSGASHKAQPQEYPPNAGVGPGGYPPAAGYWMCVCSHYVFIPQPFVHNGPPQSGYGYGAPVGVLTANKGRPTVTAQVPFDPKSDALVLRKAMKGLGTDEKAIIFILCNRTNAQRLEIKQVYGKVLRRDLINDLKSETSGSFWDVLKALMYTPARYDAQSLFQAMKGDGTDEDALIEIIGTRSPEELDAIKVEYQKFASEPLESTIKKDTSGHFERTLLALCNTAERKQRFMRVPDLSTAHAEADKLYKAGEAKRGTDEEAFKNVLCFAKPQHVVLIAQEYSKICPKYSLENCIEREFSGSIRKLLKAIVRYSLNPAFYFCAQMYKAMDGAGTNETTLIRACVTRCEIDMEDIKDIYKRTYKRSLGTDIRSDTGGNFERSLITLCKA